jgi:DNA polymerase-3 subunit epsilon
MDIHEAEALLFTSPDHRVLRRVPAPSTWEFPRRREGADIFRAIFVDTETTGLDQDVDEVIELALLPFEYERDTGAIVRVLENEAFSGLRQPSFPIPAESAKVHGISDGDVAGKTIDGAAVEALVRSAHLIVAHNAHFDRPMAEKHWPIFERMNWACSLNDINWRDEGLGSGKLDYLLMRQGWFFDGHRALGDAWAGTFLLSRALPMSNRTAMNALLTSARRPLRAVRAENTAFEARAALKQRGYRWDPGETGRSKAWWILTEDPEAEVAWLNAEIYSEPTTVPVLNVPATRRYSSRLWA